MFKPISIAVLSAAATMAHAGLVVQPPTTVIVDPEPSLFVGLTWTFGNGGNSAGTAGLTLKILSTNEEDKVAGMAGVTWNFDGSFGCDLGLAYNFGGAVLGGSYDICQQGFQLTLGGTNDPDEIVVQQAPQNGPVTALAATDG